jgi:hypothetical protein
MPSQAPSVRGTINAAARALGSPGHAAPTCHQELFRESEPTLRGQKSDSSLQAGPLRVETKPAVLRHRPHRPTLPGLDLCVPRISSMALTSRVATPAVPP